MSKRTDTIKNLFTAPPAATLSADNNPPVAPARVSSGAVRSLKDSFSEVERENQELRDRIAAGAMIIEIDTELVDPSPVSDRFRDDDTTTYELLKQSIAQRGQEVPVLVREHPATPGRYQSAYGHRRVRIARELGIPVRAILKELSDEALVVAQGLENAPREDLSFIERAIFAVHIEDAGHKRSVVQDALAIDRAEASKLIAVANAIPRDIIDAIGKAPKIGRGRWQTFADMLADGAAVKRTRAAIADASFTAGDSDSRFFAAFNAAGRRAEPSTTRKSRSQHVVGRDGQRIVQVQRADRALKLAIDKKVPAEFADFLVNQLPDLFEAFTKSSRAKETDEA
ncbi:plasmid partitioning protein RepB (plasmid) [Nitrobacteraceae bacterium UC4446_H13]